MTDFKKTFQNTLNGLGDIIPQPTQRKKPSFYSSNNMNSHHFLPNSSSKNQNSGSFFSSYFLITMTMIAFSSLCLNIYLITSLLNVQQQLPEVTKMGRKSEEWSNPHRERIKHNDNDINNNEASDLMFASDPSVIAKISNPNRLSNHHHFPQNNVAYSSLEDIYSFQNAHLVKQYSSIKSSIIQELTYLEQNRTQTYDDFYLLKAAKEDLQNQITSFETEIVVLQRKISTLQEEHMRLKSQKPREILPVAGLVSKINEDVENASKTTNNKIVITNYKDQFEINFDFTRCPIFDTEFKINTEDACLFIIPNEQNSKKILFNKLGIDDETVENSSNFIVSNFNPNNDSSDQKFLTKSVKIGSNFEFAKFREGYDIVVPDSEKIVEFLPENVGSVNSLANNLVPPVRFGPARREIDVVFLDWESKEVDGTEKKWLSNQVLGLPDFKIDIGRV